MRANCVFFSFFLFFSTSLHQPPGRSPRPARAPGAHPSHTACTTPIQKKNAVGRRSTRNKDTGKAKAQPQKLKSKNKKSAKPKKPTFFFFFFFSLLFLNALHLPDSACVFKKGWHLVNASGVFFFGFGFVGEVQSNGGRLI
jgi:hypothetical protein